MRGAPGAGQAGREQQLDVHVRRQQAVGLGDEPELGAGVDDAPAATAGVSPLSRSTSARADVEQHLVRFGCQRCPADRCVHSGARRQ